MTSFLRNFKKNNIKVIYISDLKLLENLHIIQDILIILKMKLMELSGIKKN